MPERCPKCGSEMVLWNTYPRGIDKANEVPTWRCPLDPKDCRIAELERQLEAEKNSHKRNLAVVLNSKEATEADLDAALTRERDLKGEVLALRSALKELHACQVGQDHPRLQKAFELAGETLAITSATAQQVKKSIEREALEKAWERVKAIPAGEIGKPGISIRAAILRETMDTLPRRTPPPGCDRGWMMNQNMPDTLRVGWHADHTLPPGTIEFWHDGKLAGRIDGIGLPSKEK